MKELTKNEVKEIGGGTCDCTCICEGGFGGGNFKHLGRKLNYGSCNRACGRIKGCAIYDCN